MGQHARRCVKLCCSQRGYAGLTAGMQPEKGALPHTPLWLAWRFSGVLSLLASFRTPLISEMNTNYGTTVLLLKTRLERLSNQKYATVLLTQNRALSLLVFNKRHNCVEQDPLSSQPPASAWSWSSRRVPPFGEWKPHAWIIQLQALSTMCKSNLLRSGQSVFSWFWDVFL